jgi:hypothetical protein
MNIRSQMHLAWTVNALLAAATVAVGAGLALWPVGGAEDSAADPPPPAPIQPAAKPRPPLSAYSVIWARDLQQPLFEAQAAARVINPPVTLSGTVIQPGNTYALLRTKGGQVRWAQVGETIDGAEVTEIAADSATIRFSGEAFTLKIDKQGSGS